MHSENIRKRKYFISIGFILTLVFLIQLSFIDTRLKIGHASMSDVNNFFSRLASESKPGKKLSLIDRISDNYFDFQTHIFQKLESVFIKPVSDFISLTIIKKRAANYKKNYFTGKNSMFGVTPYHSVFKLEKEMTNLPAAAKAIKLYACKGEWESAQIIIVPFTSGIEDLEIEVENNPFRKEDVQCFFGEYVYCEKPFDATDRTGWYADPLLPFSHVIQKNNSLVFSNNAYKFSISETETKSVWLNFYIDGSVKAGDYKFNVKIKAKTKNTGIIGVEQTQINFRIYDYELPPRPSLKTIFSFYTDVYEEFYKLPKKELLPDSLRKSIYKFMLAYHLSPNITFYDKTTPLKDWNWCIDNGANMLFINNYSNIYQNKQIMKQYLKHIFSPKSTIFNTGVFDFNNDSIDLKSKLLKEDYIKWLKNNIVFFRNNKLLDYACIYSFDEISYAQYPYIIAFKKLLNENDNVIPVLCTIGPKPELFGVVDIWVPKISDYNKVVCNERAKAGDKIWWYICEDSGDNRYPNFHIDRNAIDPRVIFWMAGKENIEGFLYWCINYWKSNYLSDNSNFRYVEIFRDKAVLEELNNGKRWPYLTWNSYSYSKFNGDGQLAYPWIDSSLCPSIRLINIRDGIEDYEYFYQLKLLRNKFNNLHRDYESGVIDRFLNNAYSVVPALNNYEKNPEKILSIKKEAGALLESLSKTIDSLN